MRALRTWRGHMPALLVALSTVVLSGAVEAQFGILKRAAERRVEQKVDDKANIAMLVQPTFDNTTIEITAARLAVYQAAMEKRKSQAAQNRAAIEAMYQRASATRDSANAAQVPAERDAFERNTTRYNDCRRQVTEALEATAEQKMQATMTQMQTNPSAAQTDPKLKAMFALVNEIGAAQARGDAAAVQLAQTKMMAMFSIVTDSAAIDRSAVAKCGARPVKPASMVRSAVLNARADALEQEARTLRGSGVGVRGAEVGMTDVQSRMFWERIASWLTGMRRDAPITVTFTRSEYDLLLGGGGGLRAAFSGSE